MKLRAGILGFSSIIFSFFSSLPASLFAESIRTTVQGSLAVAAENSEGQKLGLRYSESAGIFLPEDTTFIQGIELELKIPPVFQKYPRSFVFYLYRGLSPEPEKGRVVYEAKQILMQYLPGRLAMVIQIPIKKGHTLKQTPYAQLLSDPVESQEFPLLFRLAPVDKGFPDEIEQSIFQLRARPMLTDEGILKLQVKYPEGSEEKTPVEVFIDDRKIQNPQDPLFLKIGPHFLRISGDSVYRDENRSFAVEQAKTVEVIVELQDTTPLASFEAPEGTSVFLDGQRIDLAAKRIYELDPGEHTALCKVGDYTVMKKFSVQKGRTYRIVLVVDIQIQED